ncbi:hypothetical protein ACFL6G_02955 [candidate division KSB1 bacterium]
MARNDSAEILLSVKEELKNHPGENNKIQEIAHLLRFCYKNLNGKFFLKYGKTIKQSQMEIKKKRLLELIEKYGNDPDKTTLHFAGWIGLVNDSGLNDFVKREFNGISFIELRKSLLVF